MTSESASARVRCRGSFTPGMKLLLYNDSQRNQDTRLRAQTRERLVNALDRHWNCTPSKAHGFAHGAHPRKLPQEWGSAAKRELLNSRDATPRRHRLPTLVGLHLQILRKASRSSPESSRLVTFRETYTRN